MIITDGGVIIRTAVSDIRVCGRSSQGVIVMRTAENGKVISITRTDPEQENDESEENESAETVDE
jgi:DNA gyrase subunit A